METLTAKIKIAVKASPMQVWKTLTTPALIKKYLMGTDTVSDFKEGSPITYSGEYNGKKYSDKGTIKKAEPGRILQSTYWSSMSGKEDKPENYNLVTYELSGNDNETLLTLSQDNIATEKEKEHTTKNWEMVLKKLKEVTESEA
jgi:uncharacterized protein YndB with AHSA1/START domain